MKKIILSLLAAALLLTAALSCAEATHVYTLKGPTGIGMVGIMQENTGEYEFNLVGAADEIVAAVASGSADIAACPTNLAATLYQKTSGGVQLLGLNTLGVLHVLSSDDSIKSVADLAGRKIYATGQASVPEYVVAYILEQNGLTDKVEIEWVAEHSELAALMASGEVETGILPEPHVTSALMQNDKLSAVLDVTELFGEAAKKAGNDDMVLSMGCVVVNRDFAAKNPEKVAAFLASYANSVELVNSDVDTASALVEQFGVMPKAAVAKRAIPNCHITLVTGQEMIAQISPLYDVLFNANPKSVGGKLPDADFYYVAE